MMVTMMLIISWATVMTFSTGVKALMTPMVKVAKATTPCIFH